MNDILLNTNHRLSTIALHLYITCYFSVSFSTFRFVKCEWTEQIYWTMNVTYSAESLHIITTTIHGPISLIA